MAVFNIDNVSIVWRGITISGFAADKITIAQSGSTSSSSNTIVIGIAGECFTHPNTSRTWTVTTKLHGLSISYPILLQDNLNNIEDTLIVRDLNNGTTNTFTNCTISQISTAEDGCTNTVVWTAVKCNGR